MKPLSFPRSLRVLYNGTEVGILAEKDGVIGFEYSDIWLERGFPISPFSLPLSKGLFISQNQEFGGLFGVFAGSLPGKWGAYLRDLFLRQNDINPETVSLIGCLSLLDEHSLGALSYLPSIGESDDVKREDLARISHDINALLIKEDEKGLKILYGAGGSSGGARPKINLKCGDEEWIIKFPGRFDSRRIGLGEKSYRDCAAKLGINVPQGKLFEINGEEFYGSLRFDRKGKRRIHVISLSEILEISTDHPVLDYGHLFNVAKTLGGTEEEMEQVFSIMCFNVFSHNYDDHGKNFSFIYDESEKRYTLAPFFDLTPPDVKKEHELSINGKGNPEEDDLLVLAKQFGLPMKKCEKRLQVIKRTVEKDLKDYIIY